MKSRITKGKINVLYWFTFKNLNCEKIHCTYHHNSFSLCFCLHGKYGLYVLCIEFIKPPKNRSTCRGRNRKGQLFYLVVGSQFHYFLCNFLIQLFLEIQIHSARIFKEKKTICKCCVKHFIPHYSGCFHKCFFENIF